MKFIATSDQESIFGNHFDELDSTIQGLHEALKNYYESTGKVMPLSLNGDSWIKKSDELIEIFKFLNNDASSFNHPQIKKIKNVYRAEKMEFHNFLYFLNEFLIFSKFNDDSMRKLKEEYRKHKNKEYIEKDFCFQESIQQRKTETLHDLSTYIMYYGIEGNSNLVKSKIAFISIVNCWHLLNYIFDVLLEVDLIGGEETFKKTLKKYKKFNYI